MTREELINNICPECNKYNCDDRRCEDCDELLNKWLDEYDKQIRNESYNQALEDLQKMIDYEYYDGGYGTYHEVEMIVRMIDELMKK